MGYQVFARKWRPKSFVSLKGQTHVTRALTNALLHDKLHHAYLFSGTRGVGKTTIARILAKCLNCLEGVTPEPCGQCTACVDIDAGRFVDLIEVDGASRTRVEDTRELLENVQYAPSQGRYKIYLIDEVHMLSGHSFNALLKTLEEPPPYVKFILATTEPARIPVTVLSRCIQFDLSPLHPNDIIQGIEEILSKEKIPFEKIALQHIAKAAKGSMRDALSLLEQAVAFGDSKVLTQDVEQMLGIRYQRYLPVLLKGLVGSNMLACLQAVESMESEGADFEQALAYLLEAFHAAAIAQSIAPHVLGDSPDKASSLLQTSLLPEEVQLMYQIGLMGQKELHLAPSMRMGFEMTLLRMNTFCPKEKKLPGEALSTQPVAQPAKETISTRSLPPKVDTNIKAPAHETPKVLTPPQAPKSIAPSNERATTTGALKTQSLDWAKIAANLPLSGLSKMVVQHSVVANWENDALTLMLEASQKACLNSSRRDQIQAALTDHFKRPIKLDVVVGQPGRPTPMQETKAAIDERDKQARLSIEKDDTVKEIVSTFGASIENVSAIQSDDSE